MAIKPKDIPSSNTTENRIAVLDCYRFFAILSVMLFHYYSRWAPPLYSTSLYPYGNEYSYFSYGGWGVEFFFVISGFVIAFTLTKSNSFSGFLKRRMIRLWPAMLICSVIIFFTFSCLDKHSIFSGCHSIRNLLFNLTFLSPDLLNVLFQPKVPLHYLNGSYWSLWPEIQFYVVAGIIYFLKPSRFLPHFAGLVFFICFVNGMAQFAPVLFPASHYPTLSYLIFHYHKWSSLFNFSGYCLFFLMGTAFFYLYNKQSARLAWSIILTGIVLLLFTQEESFFFGTSDMTHTAVILLLFTAFILFLTIPGLGNLSIVRWLAPIGISSYSLYLIHEPIGVLFIHKFAGLWGKFNFLFPIFVIILMSLFSILSYRYLEKPIGIFLKKRIIK